MEAYEKYDHGGLLHDRYIKVADISEGSYGLVSLAKDTKFSNTLVAVKFIYPVDFERTQQYKQLSNATGRATSSPAKLRSNVESRSRRRSIMDAVTEVSSKEIRIHKILGVHANIPNLTDHFDSCLVLEYCSRGDLYEAMQNDIGPMSSQDIKDVFLQILNALSYCHSKSVFHRDLKPENILIADDWTIKVCDWGLATTERKVTNRDEFDIGSERYMAPELFSPDLEFYDAAKVDLWSVGVILLTLVFHKNPFQVANYTDKRFLQFSANREALFDFFSSMSGEMFGALRYCLNMDPSNRDLESLRHELENLKYFTMDEEYWAENSDDEYEEDNGYEEDEECEDAAVKQHDIESEDEMFKFEKEKFPPPVAVSITHEEAEKEATYTTALPKKEPRFVLDGEETTSSDTTVTAATNFSQATEDAMPYNRRADALLSPSADARPIPIGGDNGIRNTRKPFGVASYNKTGAFAMRNGHYGSNHGGSLGGKFRREDFFTPRSIFNHYLSTYGAEREQHRDQHRDQYNQRSDRKKKWNRGRRGQWKKRGQESAQGSHAYHDRRKHTSRKKRPVGPNTSGTPQPGATAAHLHTTSLAPAPVSAPQATCKEGKYIPPFLRSPTHARSPLVGALAEEIDHLALTDEVFHLEDDFHHDEPRKHIADFANGYHLNSFDAAYSSSGASGKDRRHLMGKSESGKYVPPFRRGSHSGAARPEKRRSMQPGLIPTLQQTLLEETLRSVPGENWMFKKKWLEVSE